MTPSNSLKSTPFGMITPQPIKWWRRTFIEITVPDPQRWSLRIFPFRVFWWQETHDATSHIMKPPVTPQWFVCHQSEPLNPRTLPREYHVWCLRFQDHQDIARLAEHPEMVVLRSTFAGSCAQDVGPSDSTGVMNQSVYCGSHNFRTEVEEY